MSSYGPHIVAELSDLRAVGRIDLPQMQYVYGRLNRDLAGTTASDEAAFGGGYAPKGMGGAPGHAYQSWSQLRNLLQDALGHGAQALGAAADAIVAIVNTYANTDNDIKQQLDELWRDGPPHDEVVTPGDAAPPAPPSVILS